MAIGWPWPLAAEAAVAAERVETVCARISSEASVRGDTGAAENEGALRCCGNRVPAVGCAWSVADADDEAVDDNSPVEEGSSYSYV